MTVPGSIASIKAKIVHADISETEFRISLRLDVAEEDSGGADEPRRNLLFHIAAGADNQ